MSSVVMPFWLVVLGVGSQVTIFPGHPVALVGSSEVDMLTNWTECEACGRGCRADPPRVHATRSMSPYWSL